MSPPSLSPDQHPWLTADGVRRIFDAIQKGGGTVRFVGGCVRDAVLGRTVGDIDLATDLTPHKVSELLHAANLKVSPTGIEHGTVTAVVYHKGYEITTLRRDVETFGRKAKVEFTDDWKSDAARRDFTMNALYADAGGKLYDYFNGSEDLAKGHVRFIGDASERIKEDVLRILRFFRFYAWFGTGAADADGIKACRELAPALANLSAERVWREVNKFLAADNPVPSWKLMSDEGVRAHFLPEAENIARLQNLIAAEKKFEARASSLARLAALLPPDKEQAIATARKLKMSNRETDQLGMLAILPARMVGKLDPLPFRRLLYQFGAELCREAALLLASGDQSADLEPALAAAADWQKPQFPLQGDDLLKLGLKPGPKMGETLRAIEEWWSERDFRPSRDECLAEAKRISSLSPPGERVRKS